MDAILRILFSAFLLLGQASSNLPLMGVGGAGPAVHPAGFIQAGPASCIAFGNTTVTCTFGSAVSTNDKIVMATWNLATSSTISSITDNCNTGGTSDSYTQVDSNIADGTAAALTTAYATIGAGRSSCAVTAVWSVAGSTLIAMSEINRSGALDVHHAQLTSSPGTGSNAITSGAATTGFAGEYIWAASWDSTGGAPSWSAGTGFVLDRTPSASRPAWESQLQGSAGSIAGTFTTSAAGTDHYLTGMLTFN